MQQPWDFHIRDAVEKVTFQLAEELDPDDERWPDHASLAPLRAELDEVLQAAIADWLIETKAALAEDALRQVDDLVEGILAQASEDQS